MIPLSPPPHLWLQATVYDAVANTSVGVAYLNLDGSFCWANDHFYHWLGYSQTELQQQFLWELTPREDHIQLQQQLERMTTAEPSSFSQDQQFIDPHHRHLWARLTVSMVTQPANAPDQLLVILQDISDRKLLETKLTSSQHQMRAVFEAMQDIVLICTIQDEKITGIEITLTAPLQEQEKVSEVVEQTIQFLWQEATDWEPRLQQVLNTGQTTCFEYELPHRHVPRWFSVSLSPMSDQTVLWVARDISDRKQMEKALFQEKELAQVTLQSIGDAVITTDVDRKITNLNSRAEILTGWSKTEAQGQLLSQIITMIDENTRHPIQNPVETVLLSEQNVPPSQHTLLISREGTECAIDESAAPIRDREGQVMGVVMVFNDVTQSRNFTNQLSWEANHDPLTHLKNRRKFEQVLDEALRDSHQEQQQHVLCFLDLDEFKVVNDTCGHGAGDELLCHVAKLLQAPIRAADTLARLGGDEFAILLRQCPLPQAQYVAEKLRRSIQDFRFHWANKTFRIGVSIGLVQVNQDCLSLEEILNAADSACYQAKTKGRNRIEVYQANDDMQLQQRREQQWSIQSALEADRFCLYSQAIIPTHPTSEAPREKFCELLLRMWDDQNEIITATAFLPAAKRYNLILEVDQWVIRHVLKYMETLGESSESKEVQLFMINVSDASFENEFFLQFLKTQLKHAPHKAQQICFEITETAAIFHLKQDNNVMQELKALGCQFALDECGGSLSSFIHLKSMPIDFLKIDGRFIEDIDEDPTTYTIVETINHLSHGMGIKTIAKCIENPKIREKLESIGVDYIQGFEIEKPMPLL